MLYAEAAAAVDRRAGAPAEAGAEVYNVDPPMPEGVMSQHTEGEIHGSLT